MPREGHDALRQIAEQALALYFNPRAPRGARLCTAYTATTAANFNPRAPRGARPHPDGSSPDHRPYFNPRAPRGARPLIKSAMYANSSLFQSTCPARGTTRQRVIRSITDLFQSTCPARGTTLCNIFYTICTQCISIHVPREGHDDVLVNRLTVRQNFNPRAPRGARHQYKWSKLLATTISIHVPREGHDHARAAYCCGDRNFNPRAPRGARPVTPRQLLTKKYFNPRAPRGARPYPSAGMLHAVYFNPRAPRGARPHSISCPSCGSHFNPRAPRGARHLTKSLLHY